MTLVQVSAQKLVATNVNKILDSWHKAASETGFETYFDLMTKDGVLKNVKWERKIAHYVLSVAVTNEKVSELLQLKKKKDSSLLLDLKKHKIDFSALGDQFQ